MNWIIFRIFVLAKIIISAVFIRILPRHNPTELCCETLTTAIHQMQYTIIKPISRLISSFELSYSVGRHDLPMEQDYFKNKTLVKHTHKKTQQCIEIGLMTLYLVYCNLIIGILDKSIFKIFSLAKL